MKNTLVLLLIIYYGIAYAQEKQGAVVINALDGTHSGGTNIFRYAEFMDGKVISKDHAITAVKMNYNQLLGKILFLNGVADTLEFVNPETFREIIIGNDTFYFSNGDYVRKITHFTGGNLAIVQKLKFIGREKKGAYGSYSANASINSVKTFTNASQTTGSLGADERHVYRLNDTYFVSDRFNKFLPADKRSFYRLYYSHQRELKGFIDSANIKFYNRVNLEELMQYVQTLR